MLGGELGLAVAAVLAIEAERLRLRRWNRIFGLPKSMLHLALAVLGETGHDQPGDAQ